MDGKADWFAAGLPRAGSLAHLPVAADLAQRDAPTCLPNDRIGDIRARLQATGWDLCFVVNEQRVVLGLLQGERLEAPPERLAEQVMELGPTSFRPDEPVGRMARYMTQNGLERAWITTSDGELVGVLRREDAQRCADELQLDQGSEGDSPAASPRPC